MVNLDCADPAQRVVKDALSDGGLRPRQLGGIPVEYKGGTIPPPDQRRSYN
jgi:hypothetical protein